MYTKQHLGRVRENRYHHPLFKFTVLYIDYSDTTTTMVLLKLLDHNQNVTIPRKSSKKQE